MVTIETYLGLKAGAEEPEIPKLMAALKEALYGINDFGGKGNNEQ